MVKREIGESWHAENNEVRQTDGLKSWKTAIAYPATFSHVGLVDLGYGRRKEESWKEKGVEVVVIRTYLLGSPEVRIIAPQPENSKVRLV